jgi:putative endonuclease
MRWLYRLADRVRLRAYGRTASARALLGTAGENLAHRYLQEQGLRIIARNWRTRSSSAEVDIIAWEQRPPGTQSGPTLVFVEVKSRTSDEFGSPGRAIDSVKRRNMARAASEYLRRFAPGQERIRFDVVSVVFSSPPRIDHDRDAFYLRGISAPAPPNATAATSSPL